MTANREQPLYRDTLPGGCHWSFRVGKGKVLRLVDQEGGANVGMLFYNPASPLERYNAPDTLKCQHTFRLTRGHCLYSDMGRIFCSIVADSFGGHDTVCANLTGAMVAERWGEKRFQEYLNERTRNGYDSFLVELGKYGLGRRDMAANVNFFSRTVTDADGNLSLDTTASTAGAYVDLRFEMDTLVLLHTCPHPLNPAAEYPRKPVTWAFYDSPPVTEDDECRTACPENERGFINTALYTELHA